MNPKDKQKAASGKRPKKMAAKPIPKPPGNQRKGPPISQSYGKKY